VGGPSSGGRRAVVVGCGRWVGGCDCCNQARDAALVAALTVAYRGGAMSPPLAVDTSVLMQK